MQAGATRAPVDAHPLLFVEQDSPCSEETAQPAREPAPPKLAPPPDHVQSWFAHTDPAPWSTVARIPNDASAVRAWLERHDSTTQAVFTCLSDALYATTAANRAPTIEATLREALSDPLFPTSPMPHLNDKVPMPIESNGSCVQQVLEWVVAHAHAQEDQRWENDTDMSTHSVHEGGSTPPSPTLSPSQHGLLVELAPMIPSEARPPPSIPRPVRAHGDETPVFVDQYGFVYGISVEEYRRQLQKESMIAPSEVSGPEEESDLTVAPLPAPWYELAPPDQGTAPELPALQHVHGMYEEQQKERQHEWDGFVAEFARSSQAGNEPATLWHTIFLSFRSMDRHRAPVDRRWREFRRLCEQGVPMAYRPAIWSECTQASTCAEPGEFQALQTRPPMDAQIDLDVARTMPTNLFFGSQGPGVAKLRRILHTYTHYNPTCGYCQGMNNLAAILLLTYSNEEDAFWTFVGLVDHVLPPGYYASGMLVPKADQQVLAHMVRAGQPKLAAHMKALGVELAAVTCTWFLSLFTSCLPMETLFRVWDLLMVDGSIALFRVAYAILHIASSSLLATKSASAFYHRLRFCTAHWFGADELITTAASLRGKIRVDDVDAWRARYLAKLKRDAPS